MVVSVDNVKTALKIVKDIYDAIQLAKANRVRCQMLGKKIKMLEPKIAEANQMGVSPAAIDILCNNLSAALELVKEQGDTNFVLAVLQSSSFESKLGEIEKRLAESAIDLGVSLQVDVLQEVQESKADLQELKHQIEVLDSDSRERDADQATTLQDILTHLLEIKAAQLQQLSATDAPQQTSSQVAQPQTAPPQKPSDIPSWGIPADAIELHLIEKKANGRINMIQAPPLGTGGYSDVYRGTFGGVPVAVKKIRCGSPAPLDIRERYIREVTTHLRLVHPNIVSFKGATLPAPDDQEGELMLVMEMLDGGTLSSRIAKGALGVQEKFDIALGIISGLVYLHNSRPLQVLHLDLKPENILFSAARPKVPRIIDFGLAYVREIVHSKTSLIGVQTEALGTAGYACPEMTNGGGKTDRADVFALGVILAELFAGKRLWDGRLSEASAIVASGGAPAAIEALLQPLAAGGSEEAEVVRSVMAIAVQCCAKSAADRPSAAEVFAHISAVKASPSSPLSYTRRTPQSPTATQPQATAQPTAAPPKPTIELPASAVERSAMLIEACESGNYDVVEALLDVDTNVNFRDHVSQKYPLFAALEHQHFKIVKLLVGRKAKTEISNVGMTFFMASVEAAIRSKDFELVRFLLKEKTLKELLFYASTPNSGRNVLHVACAAGCETIVDMILGHCNDDLGKNLITQRDHDGCVPFHLAVGSRNINLVTLLLMTEQCDKDAVSQVVGSPVTIAAENDDQKMVQLLLDCSATPQISKDPAHDPLVIAIQKKSTDLLKMVCETCKKRNKPLNFRPAYLALIDSVRQYGNAVTLLGLLKQYDDNHDLKRMPLLCSAVRKEHTELAKALIQVGAPIAVGGEDALKASAAQSTNGLFDLLLAYAIDNQKSNSYDFLQLAVYLVQKELPYKDPAPYIAKILAIVPQDSLKKSGILNMALQKKQLKVVKELIAKNVPLVVGEEDAVKTSRDMDKETFETIFNYAVKNKIQYDYFGLVQYFITNPPHQDSAQLIEKIMPYVSKDKLKASNLLSIALGKRQSGIIKILLNSGVPIISGNDDALKTSRDMNLDVFETILDYAVKSRTSYDYIKLAEYFIAESPLADPSKHLEAVLKRLNKVSFSNVNLLCIAVKKMKMNVVDRLIEAKVPVVVDGQDALWTSALIGYSEDQIKRKELLNALKDKNNPTEVQKVLSQISAPSAEQESKTKELRRLAFPCFQKILNYIISSNIRYDFQKLLLYLIKDAPHDDPCVYVALIIPYFPRDRIPGIIVHEKTKRGLLHYAAEHQAHCSTFVSKALDAGCELNPTDCKLQPLVFSSCIEAVDLLIDKTRDPQINGLLCTAAISGNATLIAMTVRKYQSKYSISRDCMFPKDLEPKNHTPVMLCVKYNQIDAFCVLISLGFDFNQPAEHDWSPFFEICRPGRRVTAETNQMGRVLCALCAKVGSQFVDAGNGMGRKSFQGALDAEVNRYKGYTYSYTPSTVAPLRPTGYQSPDTCFACAKSLFSGFFKSKSSTTCVRCNNGFCCSCCSSRMAIRGPNNKCQALCAKCVVCIVLENKAVLMDTLLPEPTM